MKSRNKALKYGAGLALSVISGIAAAELPAAATAAFTEVSGNATSLIGLAWGLAAVVVGGMAAIGIFKKTAYKAS